jgi:DNA-binding CsgD family transcriptional regulator
MVDLSEHEAIGRLYQAQTTGRFGKALFQLMEKRIAHELIFIALLPIKFELPSLFSEPKYKEICERYVRDSNKYDIWLQRSPVGPSVKWVRHSDYTPAEVLRKSLFYREVMRPLNSEHGMSMVAWHENNWLATLTVFRNQRQGDFTDSEMDLLQGWQIHFEAGARRLALAKEERLDDDSLSTFIWHLPTAALILDWDMNPRHFNSEALELCNVWNYGFSAFAKKSSTRRILVPRDILTAIPLLKPRIESGGLARPGPLRAVEFQTLPHPSVEGLFAKIFFIPSKSLSISRGRFLVQFNYNQAAHGAPSIFASLSQLSKVEREVAQHAAKGLSNREIGEVLRKSSGTVKVQISQIFKKLNIKSRVELANVLSSGSEASSALAPLRHQPVKILD